MRIPNPTPQFKLITREYEEFIAEPNFFSAQATQRESLSMTVGIPNSCSICARILNSGESSLYDSLRPESEFTKPGILIPIPSM
ncbi:hypothetical protein D3C80_1657570 [compost metagenome]